MTLVVPTISDSDLWRRVQAGNAEAFAELYARHSKAVYNFCFRRTGNWARAEDLVGDVFLVAWRRRREVRLTTGSGASLPWFLGVAVNVLRNDSRGRKRAEATIDRLSSNAAESDFSDELIGRLDDEEQMRAVLGVVTRLSAAEQEILALCAWAGLSYEEGAIALDVPVGTVRSRLSRAREHLRELIGETGHDIGDERLARADDGHR